MACDQAMSGCGLCQEDFSQKIIRINGNDYTPAYSRTANQWYVDADVSPFDSYEAAALEEDSPNWCGDSPNRGVLVPVAQYQGRMSDMSAIPLLATCSHGEESLGFSPPYALLDFVLSGMENPVSLLVESAAPVTGEADWRISTGEYEWSKSSSRVVLNCTGASSPDGHYRILVFGTELPDAVLTVCDGQGRMGQEYLGTIHLSPGKACSLSVRPEVEENLIWYEGFDRCAWGGDPIGGKSGWVPDVDDDAARTGGEYARVAVSADKAGCGFVQSSFEDEQSVAENHDMSDAYVLSRGFDRVRYMLRCREHPGYISVGVGSGSRGWYALNNPPVLDCIYCLDVSFSICLAEGIDDRILFQCAESGSVIDSWQLDGEDGPEESLYHGIQTSYLSMDAATLGIGRWRKVSLRLNNCSDLTRLQWLAASTEPGTHGFYLDDIAIRKVPGRWAHTDGLRVLYWNIQNGMWSDQGNNYDNFVRFVKDYAPDVCVWCEGQSNYATGTDTYTGGGYLPDGWAALAARYGHTYVSVSRRGNDAFPQVVTSRYPVTLLEAIGDFGPGVEPVTHGAGIFRVDAAGGPLYILALHLRPYSGSEYDLLRAYEMQKILSASILSPSYSSIKGWMMVGDYNSLSRVNADRYSPELEETVYAVHDLIASTTTLKDLIQTRYPRYFFPTTDYYRIDYIYMDSDLYSRVSEAAMLHESRTRRVYSELANFYYPSDHLPILVDIQ